MTCTAADMAKKAQTLISMPDSYLRIQQLIDSPTSTIKDFANVVQLDPALSARILRIANSAFFGFPSSIESTDRAMNLLGIVQLHDLVLASSAIQACSKLPIKILNKMDFWRDSIHCAVLCRMIAQQSNILEIERLFVTGLLHQIGHLIICAELAEKAAFIIDKANETNVPRYLIEREILGFDYAQVGGELAKQWKLPLSFQETIAFQLEPEKAPQFAIETSIVHLAQQLVQQLNQQKKDPNTPLNASPYALDLIDIDPATLEEIKMASKENLIESMKLLLTNA